MAAVSDVSLLLAARHSRAGQLDTIKATIDSYKRRFTQLFFLVALHSSWGPEFKWLCNPILSCHSCALAWFACPIGVYVHYAGYRIFPFLAVGMVLLLGVLIGRLLCGWVCPFGFLQDLLYKIPTPKFRMPPWTSYGKFAVLALMVVAFPFLWGEMTQWSFCRFCPASAIQVTIPNVVSAGIASIDAATAVKLAILVLVLGLVIASSRSFCKAFCPIGAMLAPLNYISFWKIKAPTEHCTACEACNRRCPQGDTPSQRILDSVPPNRALDCIVCHDCQVSCPHKEE